MNEKYIIRLLPYVSDQLWGGRRLIDEYNVTPAPGKSNAAEAWSLSCREVNLEGEDESSVVASGECAGQSLREFYSAHRELFGTRCEGRGEFPVLIKFIDALDDLSVQVHPDEDYARRVEGCAGKTECWYILDSSDEGSLLLGFKKKITRDEFKKSISDGTLLEKVKKVPVKRGDFFFVEAGTLHAICKGVLLAEIQQNSDMTYRIFDYNRKKDGKLRELHIDKAAEVTRCEPYTWREERKVEILDTAVIEPLVACELFSVKHIALLKQYEGFADETSFVSLLATDGEGTLCIDGDRARWRKGDSLLIPAGAGRFVVEGGGELLETRI